MIATLSNYINFLTKSTNAHGVHSPFVYKLVTNCFYTKTPTPYVLKYTMIKKSLLNNNECIQVKDFGAGSKVFKSNTRKISKIAKIAGISDKKAKLLIRFLQYFKPNTVLEIGTSLGLGTSAMHLGNYSASMLTLEGCPNTAKIAKQLFKKFDFNNITILIGDFNKTISEAIKNKKYDLIYFDGNHTKKATLHYFELCLNAIHDESIFIFDDINWSTEMLDVWEIIKKHPKVTVTINTFFWGIVFFRKEQAKEHFTIRV